MIKSMTGFGRAEIEEDNRKICVEIKAVNHRYLDESIKMPKSFGMFEAPVRTVLKEYIERGKVDVYITFEDLGEENVTIRYNKQVAAEYLKYLSEMKEDFALDDDIRLSTLSRYPEVLTMEEAPADEESIWKTLEKAVRAAAEKFRESRIKEGENLKADLISKLDGMLEQVGVIEARSPEIVKAYQEKLENKIRELLGSREIDDARILTEVGIFADKICVDEEIVRLKSHIQAVKDELVKGGTVGRKLDFLAQEMNREANTTLSKANDLELSNTAINIKTEIEKIREQIQNIE
ncbi:TIGR00255 family protein [Lachnospiraceae bacterium XPB1003]|nr:TIGR00255 family protein [Lachnospiraceae bacterium XPB1003]